MSWFNRQSELDAAISRGDLELAVDRWRRVASGATRSQPRHQLMNVQERTELSKRLTNALVNRANASISAGNLIGAWHDLTNAAEVALPSDQDHVSRQTSHLIELTIESAEGLLREGRTRRSLQLIANLHDRKVLDWRADRIRKVAKCLQQAEDYSAQGRFREAADCLAKAQKLQPELPNIESRIDCKNERHQQLETLSKQLQKLALRCHWKEVNECCDQILSLAPRHEIAVAAKKHSLRQIKRQTSAGSRVTNAPYDSNRASASNPFFQLDRPVSHRDRETVNQRAGETVQGLHAGLSLTDLETFLMWVDGVGGFLVCLNPIVLIGQATEGSPVSIALQADLRQRHARIEQISGQHLVQPMGKVAIDGEPTNSAFVLRDGQRLDLGDGVRLKYHQPHPLSKTSRLDFVSRHRTQPWSDAVLLASQSIILGPNRNNHVFCPHWRSDLILFCRSGQWFCRSKRPFQLDGQPCQREGLIRPGSHVAGDDFSLTIEPVLKAASERHGN